ncbi:RTA1 like protein-domain-containing protein [Lactifluus subvellereus]|nr:RTA1 like protein-domain-containing protein [Lactifluus subvellereus]
MSAYLYKACNRSSGFFLYTPILCAVMSPLGKVLTSSNDFPYNYVPTKWVCAMFIAFFSLSSIIHVVQAIRSRVWWLFPTAVLCGLLEVIGWSGRLWSSKNPFLHEPFIMQISTTIVAPTPLVAANFIILGRITRRLGPLFCRLSPRWYMILFLSCDIVALVVQSIGGGIASGTQPVLGGHIALGGIALQLGLSTVHLLIDSHRVVDTHVAVLILYSALAAEFLVRFTLDRPVRYIRDSEGSIMDNPRRGTVNMSMKRMLFGMSVMTVLLLTRSIYRTIELSGGWDGKVISTQWLFNVFDGAMVVLAMFTLNVFHPGVLLCGLDDELGMDIHEQKDQNSHSE